MITAEVVKLYGLPDTITITPFGTGLINHTWLVAAPSNTYILQKINQNVFKSPEAIAANIKLIGNYLHQSTQRKFLMHRWYFNVFKTFQFQLSSKPFLYIIFTMY